MTAEIFQIKAVLLKCAFVAVSIRERIFKILLGGFGRGDGRPASKKTIYIRGHEKKYSWAYGSLLVELWRFRFFLNLSGNDSRWSSGAFVSGAELFLLPDDLRRSVFSIFGTLRSERMFFLYDVDAQGNRVKGDSIYLSDASAFPAKWQDASAVHLTRVTGDYYPSKDYSCDDFSNPECQRAFYVKDVE